MSKKIKREKKELREQIDFLKGFLRSLDDIKKGRVKKFEFSKY